MVSLYRCREVFLPGAGESVNEGESTLGEACHLGGISVLSHGASAPHQVHHTMSNVIYIGETSNVRRRMSDWGDPLAFGGRNYRSWPLRGVAMEERRI